MRAVVFSIPASTTAGFAWRWRSEDHRRESAHAFGFYADCVADAKAHGYTVELGRIQSHTAPKLNTESQRT